MNTFFWSSRSRFSWQIHTNPRFLLQSDYRSPLPTSLRKHPACSRYVQVPNQWNLYIQKKNLQKQQLNIKKQITATNISCMFKIWRRFSFFALKSKAWTDWRADSDLELVRLSQPCCSWASDYLWATDDMTTDLFPLEVAHLFPSVGRLCGCIDTTWYLLRQDSSLSGYNYIYTIVQSQLHFLKFRSQSIPLIPCHLFISLYT